MSHFPEFDLYEALHLSKDASSEDVRTHYVRIIRRNHIDHPDFLKRIRSQFPIRSDEGAAAYQERIAEIAKRSVQRFNVAYEILSNPTERSAYDRYLGVSQSFQEALKPADPVMQRPDGASRGAHGDRPDNGQFFNRGSKSAQGSRRRRTEAESDRDKYCVWKR